MTAFIAARSNPACAGNSESLLGDVGVCVPESGDSGVGVVVRGGRSSSSMVAVDGAACARLCVLKDEADGGREVDVEGVWPEDFARENQLFFFGYSSPSRTTIRSSSKSGS